MGSELFRNRMVTTAARFMSRHAGWVALGTFIFVSFFASFLPRLTPKNDSYDFVVDRDPVTDYFHRFRTLFEKDEFIVIAFRQPDLFTPTRLMELKKLTEELESLERVTDVLSLANVADMKGMDDAFEADDFLREVPDSPERLAALRRRALANPMYQPTLLSVDGQTAAIVVFMTLLAPSSGLDSEKEVRALLKDVQRVLAPYRSTGTHFAVAGRPVTTFYLGQYMEADARVFIPISLFLCLGTIWLVFRNIHLLFFAGVGILMTLAATLGLAGLAGITLNNASIAVIPLVMALALSDLVHVFTHLHRPYLINGGGHARGGLQEILKAVLFPCLLTSVNTGIGFFSYTFNSVSAIRSFGWLAAAGMMFEFIVTFGFVAPLLAFVSTEKIYRDPRAHTRHAIPRMLEVLHAGVTRHPGWPLSLCLVGLVVSIGFAKDIKVNTNLEELFNKKSVLRQDINYVRTHLAGMEAINVVFESSRNAFKDPALLSKIDTITQELKQVPSVESVIGFGEYLKEMNKAFHGEDPAHYRLPASRNMVEQYLLLYGRDDLDDVVTPGFDVLRLMVRADAPGSRESRDVIERIQKVLDQHPIPGITTAITGSVALSVRTMDVMVTDQMNNIGQTVIVIWLLMVWVLRSWGLALLFLVPNLFPIVVNFGIMGFFAIPLDTGTSLIAASAFGIIVDDTVHFFTVFGQHRRQGQSVKDALDKTAAEKGEAMFSSFLVMGMGFGVLLLSKFQPLIMFGLLNIIILVVGMIGDQVLLKSLISLWSRRFKKRVETVASVLTSTTRIP